MQSKSEICIEQALHGYDRGHRELASSIALDDQSRAEMLVLSDLLASSAVDRGRSYLTAYPLKGASRYVLARTWAAGREFRPGSVWTHSLLLDYQSLVLLPDLMRLNALFRQPIQRNYESYAQPLKLSTRAMEERDVTIALSEATTALAKLYGPQYVDDIVLPSGQDQDNQVLALALWRQMWPALRRQFAFTTAEEASLPGFGFPCTLCFTAYKNFDATPCYLPGEVQGFNALLDDLPAGGPTALRTFLSRYVIESREPRQTAPQLADFFGHLEGIDAVERLNLAQPLIAENRLPRLAKDLATDAVNHASDFDQILFLAQTLRDTQVGIQSDVLIERAAAEPDRLGVLLSETQSNVEGSFGASLFEGLVRQVPVAYLSKAATAANRLKLAKLRPETTSHQEWWPSDDTERAQLVGVLADYDGINWGAVLNVLSPSLGPRMVSALLIALDDGAEQIGMELFLHGKPRIKDVAAEWFIKRPIAFGRLASVLQTVSPEQLKALSQAQLRQRPPFRLNDAWRAIVAAAGSVVLCSDESLTLGYLAALDLQGSMSIQLGRLVLDRLFQACQTYQLGGSERRYLELSLRDRNIASYGATAIAQSALEKWPVNPADCGVLTFVQNRELVFALAHELDRREGLGAVEAARHSRQLSEAVTEYLDAYLRKRETMRKAAWPFRWW